MEVSCENFITATIEYLIDALPEDKVQQVTKAIALKKIFVEAYAVLPSEQLRQKKEHETDEDYELFLVIADPCGHFINIEKQSASFNYTVADVQSFIFEHVMQPFKKALETDSTLTDVFKEPVTLDANKTLFKTRTSSRKKQAPTKNIFDDEWGITDDENQFIHFEAIIRPQDGASWAWVDAWCVIRFPDRDHQILKKEFRTITGYTSFRARDAIRNAIKTYMTSRAAKIIAIQIIQQSPAYAFLKMNYQDLGIISLISAYYLHYLRPAILEEINFQAKGLKLLAYKYYFDAVMSAKYHLKSFESLTFREIDILKSPAVMQILAKDLCSFDQARGFTIIELELFQIPLYLDKILNKEIPLKTIARLTPEQWSILKTPSIRNLQTLYPDIPFYSVIHISKDGLALISSEFYFNLLRLKKIAFCALQRINRDDAHLLQMPLIIRALANLKTISSSVIAIILVPNYATLIMNGIISLTKLENITPEQTKNLLLPNISALIYYKFLTLDAALVLPTEKMEILSQDYISYLLMNHFISLKHACQLTTDDNEKIQNNSRLQIYLTYHCLKNCKGNRILLLHLSDEIFWRIQSLEPAMTTANQLDNVNAIQEILSEFSIAHDLERTEIISAVIELLLKFLKYNLLKNQSDAACRQIKECVSKAEREGEDGIWQQELHAIREIIHSPCKKNNRLPFLTGGPNYNRIAYSHSNTETPATFFHPLSTKLLLDRIKTLVDITHSLAYPDQKPEQRLVKKIRV